MKARRRKSKGGIAKAIRVKVKQGIRFPILTIAAIVVVIIVLFVLGVQVPFGGTTEGQDIVDKKVNDYVKLYLGFINVTVMNKTLADNTWTVSLSAQAPDGIVFMNVLMDARDFSVQKIYQSVIPPKTPNTIIDLGKDVGCSAEGLTTVDIYIDPYDPWTRKHDWLVTNFTVRFKDSIRTTYRIVPTFSFDALEEVDNDAIHAFRYLSCAKNSQYFQSIKGCIFEKYEKKGEFLNENETQSCVLAAGMDVKTAAECANGQKAISELSIDERFAETFLGRPTTPVLVFDCKKETFPLYADKAFCYLYPKLSACKQ